MINFHRFAEILESVEVDRSIDADTKYAFLDALGQIRQKLAEAHRVVDRNRDQKQMGALSKYLVDLCGSISHLLGPFERKPVLGDGVEFRMINTSLGSLVSADGRLPRWIEEALARGQTDRVMQVLQGAEKTLTGFYKAAGGGMMGGMHEPMIQPRQGAK